MRWSRFTVGRVFFLFFFFFGKAAIIHSHKPSGSPTLLVCMFLLGNHNRPYTVFTLNYTEGHARTRKGEGSRRIKKERVLQRSNPSPPTQKKMKIKTQTSRQQISLSVKVELPACSSSLYLSSFIPSSCLLWNSLPPDVSSSSSLSSFTLMLDSHFSFDRFTLGLS